MALTRDHEEWRNYFMNNLEPAIISLLVMFASFVAGHLFIDWHRRRIQSWNLKVASIVYKAILLIPTVLAFCSLAVFLNNIGDYINALFSAVLAIISLLVFLYGTLRVLMEKAIPRIEIFRSSASYNKNINSEDL
jgi:hypothetical protein